MAASSSCHSVQPSMTPGVCGVTPGAEDAPGFYRSALRCGHALRLGFGLDGSRWRVGWPGFQVQVQVRKLARIEHWRLDACSQLVIVVAKDTHADLEQQDRKSTRLNSSH